jgi:hypothetical protein
MNRKTVNSSNILSIGYDQKSQVLEVEFNNGCIYQYSGVPERIYNGLISAASHGTYLNQNIKNCYSCRRIS